MNLTEAQLYNLYSRSCDEDTIRADFIRLMAVHLRVEHGMPIHKISRRMGVKMTALKKIINSEEP